MSDHRRLGNTSDAPGAVSSVDPKKTAEPKSSAEDEQEAFHETFEVLPAGAKDGKNKAPIQKEPTRKPPKVKNIVGNENPQNPSREISVKWDKPDLRGDFQYEVYLKGDTEYKPVSVDSSRQEAWFKDLKSDTKYIAHVSIIKNEKKSESACSKPIYTSKAPQAQGFNIKTDGKPEIMLCSADLDNNGASYVSRFTWALPDLGVEKTNYNVVGTQASLKEDGGDLQELTLENEIRAKPVALRFGTCYKFTVKRTYLDLDQHEMIGAISEWTLYTDIGMPKIEEVKWHGQEITVLWSPAKGATKHTLKVSDEVGEPVVEEKALNEQSFTFTMTRSCNYGKICILVIEASGVNNKTKKSNPRHCLIGGEMAVTDVVAEKCQDCPRREIFVKWKPPKRNPEGFKVQLYIQKKDKHNEDSEVTKVEQEQLSHKFKKLKTSTQYFCKVMPIYGGVAKDGSLSNVVKTDDWIKSAFESQADFGKPEHIDLSERDDEENNLVVDLKWSPVRVGENYTILSFNVEVSEPRRWPVLDTVVFTDNLSPKMSSIDIHRLKRGKKYNVSITTHCIELDKPDKPKKFSKTITFCTSPSKASMKPCELKDGLITFSWDPVVGAKKYRLVIKDESLKENVSPDEHVNGNDCRVKVKMTEKLCIGKTCMSKIYTEANGLTSETEWTQHLIGGKLVPRNLLATKNTDDPKRSILVIFDVPKKGPADKYKIIIVPKTGNKKTIYTSITTNIIKYIRKGVSYKFKVFAKHGEEWSEGAESTPLQTDGGDETKPVMNIDKAKGSHFYMQSAQFTGNTTNINIRKGDAFGKVRDLRAETISHEKDAEYKVELIWKVPSFDNNAYDYKVEKYKVEIRRSDSTKQREFYSEFQEDLHVYKTGAVNLNLGEAYEILVSTIYIDIDADEEYISSAASKRLQTKPCKPGGVKCRVIKNEVGDDALQIEWNAATGAKSYEVEIFTEYSNETSLLFKHEVTGPTKWIRTFDNEFGFGTTYHAVITAIGDEGKTNSTKTNPETLGGNFAPKRVCASISDEKVIDPNTQVHLSWEQPAEQPECYEITVISEDENDMGVIRCEETTKLIEGLKAGVFYTFKVEAINKVNKKKSGGSVSNRVQTNPTPTQVKDVQTRPGQNPSTSVNIFWGKVNAEKQNESTKYRVLVGTSDEKIRNEMYVTTESAIVEGLLPGTKYFTTVAGGNSLGFGRNSEREHFETELGVPKNVKLLNNPTSVSASLILEFSKAEGKPTKYFGGLIKNENLDRYEDAHYDEVQTGHVFNELEANTKYIAIIYAVFENDRQGKAAKSNPMLTAPSKVEICDSGHSIIEEVGSSRKLFLTWESDDGCREHEVLIKHGDTIENQQIVKNIKTLDYFCLHEASRYCAQIRTKNDIFGPWSNEVIIQLAPAKLRNVTAVLEKNDDRILIQFKKPSQDCVSYLCQAVCNDTNEGSPAEAKAEDEKNIVSLHFTPAQHAQKYSFMLWARDTRGVAGESTHSASVISRPATGEVAKIEREEENPSTDIKIFWKDLERCDEYHVKIKKNGGQKYESIVRSTENTCNYRCQSPGSIYSVRVRGIRESVWGSWSEKVSIHLVPAQVELVENKDDHAPVETIKVKWKELQLKPTGYHVILYQKGVKVDEKKTETTEHEFVKSAKPGSICYCTVAAFNDAGEGKPVKTMNYRTIWNLPGFLLITADKNDPARRATITWDRPENVDCFKLKIENKQTGAVTSIKLDKTTYIFESGMPGNSYSVRLYSGCDAHYSADCLMKTMTMKPSPPTKITAVAYRHENGIKVTFEDNSANQKSYEVCAKRVTKEEEEYEKVEETTDCEQAVLKNLIPGESYEVSVTTLFNKERSKKITLKEYVQTYPAVVQNLECSEENGVIVFTWDALKFMPDKYIVQWRVDNESITEESTRKTRFEIRFLKPARSYNLRVMAANSAGDGEMTQWETYITDPLPPYNLKVTTNEKSPKTSVIVKYEDDPDVNKSYKITAFVEENGQEVEKVSVITTEYTTYINRLEPGRSYFFKVQTIFCGKMSKDLFFFEN